MSDSTVFDSTPAAPSGYDRPGFEGPARVARAGVSPRRAVWRPLPLLLLLPLAACADRHIIFCDPSLPPNNGGCPVAGAGGLGGGGGTGGTVGVAGSSGAAGVAGTGGGSGGSGGVAGTGGAPPTGGTGGAPDIVDASAPPPDAGLDAGAAADAAP